MERSSALAILEKAFENYPSLWKEMKQRLSTVELCLQAVSDAFAAGYQAARDAHQSAER